MSRLSRFLPKFLRSGKGNGKQNEDKAQCKIIFLDENEFYIPYKACQFYGNRQGAIISEFLCLYSKRLAAFPPIKGGLKGQVVLDKVYEELNLLEKDYFGLRFIDSTGQAHWLDPLKTLSSQLKGCYVPYTFYFGVKFYPPDPCKLKEELTRYQFFLQVKRDILHGRLPVSFEEAAELFAYAVQSEIGDYESMQLPPGYVSEFQFVPNQTEELEAQIAHLHRRLGGTVPATAELKFLDKVKWLDMYGVDLHPVTGEGNTEYFLGLTPTGIVVYKNKTKVGNYFWPRITKVNMKGKVFVVRVKGKINDEHTYAFELATKTACKHLWKCCVEHHAFFRLNQLGSTPRESKPYRSTSRHRSSGRVDRQNNAEHQSREQPHVIRVQSRRQARRAMSDPRLHQADVATGIQFSEGHVTMVVKPENISGPRHRSLPDLKGRESPTSTRSAPWETNMDVGLYTSGRESPISVTQSENINHARRHRDSDSEAGYRRKYYRQGYDSDGGSSRYKYFPSSRKGSDNESDVSFTRRRRHDSGSESDVSPKLTARQRKTKSMGPDKFESEWQAAIQGMYLSDKESRQNGSAPSLHSAPAGELRQKKMRRRRSKSPGTSKRPPEELKRFIEFEMLEPTQDFTEDQLKEIPYMNVETKAEAFKVKYSPSNRRRYRSPKRKSAMDLEPRTGYMSEEVQQAYTRTPERTPEPSRRQATSAGPGYYSDTGSMPRRNQQGSNFPKQPQNNSVAPHSKHYTTMNIRSSSQFHENALFYEPKLSSHYTIRPPITNSSYHPPPNAVFKPIDQIDDRGSSNTDPSLANISHQEAGDTKHLHMDDLEQGQPDVGQGQGLDEDRNHDSGLNSSLSSSSQGHVAMTPSVSRGNQRMYGTQDAIARLYSSPAGTRRPMPHNMNQSPGSTNQNSSYNRGTPGTNQYSSYNGSGPGLTNQGMSYNSPDRRQTGAYSAHSMTHSIGNNSRTQSTFYRSQTGPVYEDNNKYNGVHMPENRYSSDKRDQGQNGYLPQSSQRDFSSDSRSHNAMFSESDNRHNTRSSRPQNSRQHGYMPNVNDSSAHQNYNPSAYNDYNQINDGQVPLSGNLSSTPGTFYTQPPPPPQYSSPRDRLGLQPSWQYLGSRGQTGNQSGREKSPARPPLNGVASTNPSPMNRNRPSDMGNNSVPANQNGTSGHVTHASTNGSGSSSHMAYSSANQNGSSGHMTSMTPPTFRSPDSAISSLASNPNSTRSSPRKPRSEMGLNNNHHGEMDKMADGFSRTRAPAFGRSDIWTEL